MDSGHALVISDVRFYRDGITRALQEDGFRVDTAESRDPRLEALADACDVALVDLVDESLAQTLGSVAGRVPIVGLALTLSPPIAAAAAWGVRAFVGCDQSLAALVHAVRSAASGEAVCPPSIAAALFSSLRRVGDPPEALPIQSLTAREREIAQLLVRGMTNKEIASALTIEPATVKNHVHQVLRKLDVTTRGHAADALRGVWT